MTLRYFALAVAFIILCAAPGAAESDRVTPTVKIVRDWSASVVNISTERIVTLNTHPFWGQFGGMINMPNMPEPIAAGTMKLNSVGSGVVVSEKGVILTNAHVVEMASTIYVVLNDGKRSRATVELVSPEYDLALIKIEPPESLKSVKIAGDVMIGETVVAIGNPLGLENSVSSGIVSGINRSLVTAQGVPVLTGLIQTDVSINQGSSGGALFNLEGELVGINLALVQGANSISFAVPYTGVKEILKKYNTSGGSKEPAVMNTIRMPSE